jgi:alkylation response protein AidB-like acyl-CoA dehydrogenase
MNTGTDMKTSRETLLERARSVRDLAKTHARDAEQNRQLSKDVIAAIGTSGVLGWLAPAEFGGEEQ